MSVRLAVPFLIATIAAGCEAKDPCDSGTAEEKNGQCAPIPIIDAGAAASDAAESDGEAGAATVSSFGKACQGEGECSGDAPICAAPYLPYCTQINCAAGEANANACPASWTCMSTPGQPSACMRP